MEEKFKIAKAMGAGLVASGLVTAVVLGASFLGFPSPEYLGILDALPGGDYWDDQAWNRIIALAWHFNFGVIIFPHIYVYAIYPILPNPPRLKGLIFGAGIWLFLESLVLPMFGLGFFSRHTVNPLYNVLSALAVHLLYGLVLGAVASNVREVLPKVREATSAVTGGTPEDMNEMPSNTNPNEGPVYDGSDLSRSPLKESLRSKTPAIQIRR